MPAAPLPTGSPPAPPPGAPPEWPPAEALGFWRIATQEPDRTALILEDGTERTFGELRDLANRVASALRKSGLGGGSSFAALLPNDWHYYAIHLAAMQAGLYFCPLNHHLTGDEIAYVLEDSDSELLIAHEHFAAAARAATSSLPRLEGRRISIGPIEGFTAFDAWIRDAPREAPEPRTPGSVMAYTSGTTGRPKGVRRPLPAGNPDEIAAGGTLFSRAFGLSPFDGVHLVVGPLYHAGPSAFSWGALHVGHAQVVTNRFDAEDTLRLIDRHGVTNSHLVATMFHRLLALSSDVRERYDVSSLRMVAHSAAPTPIEVKQRMMDWWGPVIWETYGGTEGAATIAKPHHWLSKPGTVGRPVRGVKVSVLDEAGEPCPPGHAGAIYIETSGPRFEYWKDEAKTRASHRGRSFTLGDLGYLDDDGFLFLTGRQSEVIISGGVNIYPAEVEAVLHRHPGVADVAVIGAPDEEWGERVVALIEPTSGFPTDSLPEALVTWCRSHIASFKCPRVVEIRSELPRSENGKLYRRRLRDEFWSTSGRKI